LAGNHPPQHAPHKIRVARDLFQAIDHLRPVFPEKRAQRIEGIEAGQAF
jgi:hypothetical protein